MKVCRRNQNKTIVHTTNACYQGESKSPEIRPTEFQNVMLNV